MSQTPHSIPPGAGLTIPRKITKGGVLVVEDEESFRETIEDVLEEQGYDVVFAGNGREALRLLYTETLPDIIVFDLNMPVMDGWEFRTHQKDDPTLGLIPVIAISADVSSQAAAISAQAYLRKPFTGDELVTTIEKVLFENERQKAALLDETERLAALGRLAAGVGHEVNNPLAFLMLNLTNSRRQLEGALPELEGLQSPNNVKVQKLKDLLADVAGMLEDCQIGGERICEIVRNLQQLSRKGDDAESPIDLHRLIEQSISMVGNEIRHRARLIKNFEKIPAITGNTTALGQVFLNLLLNAAQAIPDGNAEQNEIRVSTRVQPGSGGGAAGGEIVIEISDSGRGIAPDILSHVFEPFFTTKSVGQGTGLGLSISRQTINNHGGRIVVESEPGKGTTFFIFLPLAELPT